MCLMTGLTGEMNLNCSETLGFQLRTLAEQRDAEIRKFTVSNPFVEANAAKVFLKTNGLVTNKYGYPWKEPEYKIRPLACSELLIGGSHSGV